MVVIVHIKIEAAALQREYSRCRYSNPYRVGFADLCAASLCRVFQGETVQAHEGLVTIG
jgi:hypothetical protein